MLLIFNDWWVILFFCFHLYDALSMYHNTFINLLQHDKTSELKHYGERGTGGCQGRVPAHMGPASLLDTRALCPKENASVPERWVQVNGHFFCSVHFIELCIKIQSLLLTARSSSKTHSPIAFLLLLFLPSWNQAMIACEPCLRHTEATPLLKSQFLSWVLNFVTEL